MAMNLRRFVREKIRGKKPVNPRQFLTSYIQNGDRGAEIGVWMGDFSEMILSSTELAQYLLIDPYEFMPQFPNRMYGGKKAQSQADMDDIFHATQDRLADYPGEQTFIRKRSHAASNEIENSSLDFVYVDGNHYYQGVYDDISDFLPKLKIGGYLILDDWTWTDDDGRESVKLAACDFIRHHPNCLQLVEIRAVQAVYLVIDNLSDA